MRKCLDEIEGLECVKCCADCDEENCRDRCVRTAEEAKDCEWMEVEDE